jgi:hypothetical protein
MTPKTSPASASAISVCPAGSALRGLAAFDSGVTLVTTAMAASPMGRLIRKIPRQPSGESTSAPPTIGPSASDSPITPDHTPIARARSAGFG